MRYEPESVLTDACEAFLSPVQGDWQMPVQHFTEKLDVA
jgi:hypothetical protein